MAGIPGLICRRRTRALIALAAGCSCSRERSPPRRPPRMRSKVIDRHLCKTVGGGRFVDIPGFPGEKIDRRLLADIRWMKRRFHIFITDGYSTDPAHARNGEHPIGLAADIVPNRAKGGTWRDIGALARKAEPRAGPSDRALALGGLERRSDHGRGHHLHLSWMHSETEPEDPARVVYTRKCPEPPDEPPPLRRPSRSRERAASRRRPGDAPRPAAPRRLTCRAGFGRSSRRRFAEHALSSAGPCDPPSRAVPGRSRRGWLEPGVSAAHARYRLRLLPSGSDLVHGRALRGTWPSTPPATYRPRRPRPSDGHSAPLERIAGDRAPLPPRLARSTGILPWQGRPACWRLSSNRGARSSVGERSLHTREVAGSKPAAPISKLLLSAGFSRASGNKKPGRTVPISAFLPAFCPK